MAFENGNNMFDYCGEIFKRYQKDNLVFYKALQLLAYFETRNDYPYCTDELSEVLEKVLGYNLGWLFGFCLEIYGYVRERDGMGCRKCIYGRYKA